MEYAEFIEINEIHRRSELAIMRRLRVMGSLVHGRDLRSVFPLEGDFDDLPVDTEEERQMVMNKLGAKKFFSRLDKQKAN